MISSVPFVVCPTSASFETSGLATMPFQDTHTATNNPFAVTSAHHLHVPDAQHTEVTGLLMFILVTMATKQTRGTSPLF
jgi:hypothetical protein